MKKSRTVIYRGRATFKGFSGARLIAAMYSDERLLALPVATMAKPIADAVLSELAARGLLVGDYQI